MKTFLKAIAFILNVFVLICCVAMTIFSINMLLDKNHYGDSAKQMLNPPHPCNGLIIIEEDPDNGGGPVLDGTDDDTY